MAQWLQLRDRMSSNNPTRGTERASTGAGRFTAPPTTRAAARDVAERGRETVQQASGEMMDVAEEQVNELTEQLRGIVRALDAASAQLHEQEQGTVAEQVDSVADGLARICDRMASGSLRELGDDASAWARENPLGFLGGSVAMGFVLSRLLKAAPPTGEAQTQQDEPFEAREGVEHGTPHPIQ